MKKVSVNIFRGISSLIVFAVMVSTLSFVIQSCNVSMDKADSDQELARTNFVTLAKSTAPQLRSIEERSVSILAADDQSDKSKSELRREAKKTLTPLIKSGQELLDAYGFTDADFKGTGMSKDDPHALYLAFAVLKVAELQQEEVSFANILMNSCAEPAYASKLWDCLVVAVGMEIGIEIFRRTELQTIAGRKKLIKLFTKLGARYLGYVGVAISTYHFIDCMWLSE